MLDLFVQCYTETFTLLSIATSVSVMRCHCVDKGKEMEQQPSPGLENDMMVSVLFTRL